MNRHIQYTLALMCAKNRVDIFSSFLDIRQNVEWPRFLAHPVVTNAHAVTRGVVINLFFWGGIKFFWEV